MVRSVLPVMLPVTQVSGMQGKGLGYNLRCLVLIWHLIKIICVVEAGWLG